MPRQKQSNPKALKQQQAEVKKLLRKKRGQSRSATKPLQWKQLTKEHFERKSKTGRSTTARSKNLKRISTGARTGKKTDVEGAISRSETARSDIAVTNNIDSDGVHPRPCILKNKYDLIKERRCMARLVKDSHDSKEVEEGHAGATGTKKMNSFVDVNEYTRITKDPKGEKEQSGDEKQAVEALLQIKSVDIESVTNNNTLDRTDSYDPHSEKVVGVSEKDKERGTDRGRSSTGSPAMNASPLVFHASKYQNFSPGNISRSMTVDVVEADSAAADSIPKKAGRHVCPYCGHKCAKPSVLKKHLRSHTGERPYPCNPCGFAFKTKSNLYKHCKSHAHAVKVGIRVSDSPSKGSNGEDDSEETESEDETEFVQNASREHSTLDCEQDSTGMDGIGQGTSSMSAIDKRLAADLVTSSSQLDVLPPQTIDLPPRVPDFSTRDRMNVSPEQVRNEPKLTEHSISRLLKGSEQSNKLQSEMSLGIAGYKVNVESKETMPIHSHDKNPSPDQQEPSTGTKATGSNDQILIPLSNFNIVKAKGQYHLQLPVGHLPAGALASIQSKTPGSTEAGKDKIQERIQKLISDNQEIMDNSDLESVKPRKLGFDFRDVDSLAEEGSSSRAAEQQQQQPWSENSRLHSGVGADLANRQLPTSSTEKSTRHIPLQNIQVTHSQTESTSSPVSNFPTTSTQPSDGALLKRKSSMTLGSESEEGIPFFSKKMKKVLYVPHDDNHTGDSAQSPYRPPILNNLLTAPQTGQVKSPSAPNALMFSSSLQKMASPFAQSVPGEMGPKHLGSPRAAQPERSFSLAGLQPTGVPVIQHTTKRDAGSFIAGPSRGEGTTPGLPGLLQIGRPSLETREEDSSDSQTSLTRPNSLNFGGIQSTNTRYISKSERRRRFPNQFTPTPGTSLKGVASPRDLGSLPGSSTGDVPAIKLGSPRGRGGTPNLDAALRKGFEKFPFQGLNVDVSPLAKMVKFPPAGSGGKPIIDPRVLLSPEALSIAESVMKKASPTGGQTPSTPVEQARELGRLVAHAFHNAGGNIGSVLSSSAGNLIVGPIATPTSTGAKSQIFILPSPSKTQAPSFPCMSPSTPSKPFSPTGAPRPFTPTGASRPFTPTGSAKPFTPTGASKVFTPTGPLKPFTLTGPPKPFTPTGPPKPFTPTGPPKPFTPTGPPKPFTPSGPHKPFTPTSPPKSFTPTGPPKPFTPTGQPNLFTLTGPSLHPLTPTGGSKKPLTPSGPQNPFPYGLYGPARPLTPMGMLHSPISASAAESLTPVELAKTPTLSGSVHKGLPGMVPVARAPLAIEKMTPHGSQIPSRKVSPRSQPLQAHNSAANIPKAFTPVASRPQSMEPGFPRGTQPTMSNNVPMTLLGPAPNIPSPSLQRKTFPQSPVMKTHSSKEPSWTVSSPRHDGVRHTWGSPVHMDAMDLSATTSPLKTAEANDVTPSTLPDKISLALQIKDGSGGSENFSCSFSNTLLTKGKGKVLGIVKNEQGQTLPTVPIFLYANMSARMCGVTKTTNCCSKQPQPMYAAQGINSKISMYSNWRTARHVQHPLGISWKVHLGMYNSHRNKKGKVLYNQCNFTPGGMYTDSKGYNKKAKDTTSTQKKSGSNQTSMEVSSESNTSPDGMEPPLGSKTPHGGDLPSMELTRVPIFPGGYESHEDYVYVRGRGRGKYICGECGIRCKKPSMLKKHIRTHTDLRPYQCNGCSFSFKTKGNLTKHMKSKAHVKKCLEMGVPPGLDLESATDEPMDEEDLENQFADVDSEDTDSAGTDDEEDEMDDDSSIGISASSSIPSATDPLGPFAPLKHVHRQLSLRRAYSDIDLTPASTKAEEKDPDREQRLDELMSALRNRTSPQPQSARPSRSEVVCKLTQHLTNKQQKTFEERNGSLMRRSMSVSHLAVEPSIRISSPSPTRQLNESKEGKRDCSLPMNLSTSRSLSSLTEPLASQEGPASDHKNILTRRFEQRVGQNPGCDQLHGLPLSINSQRERLSKSSSVSQPGNSGQQSSLVPPMIEPVSDDEEDILKPKKQRPPETEDVIRFAPPSTTTGSDAIRDLLLARAPVWPFAMEGVMPSSAFSRRFIPPSPSQLDASPSPNLLLPYSPISGSRPPLVSPMSPSKLFQLPSTVLSRVHSPSPLARTSPLFKLDHPIRQEDHPPPARDVPATTSVSELGVETAGTSQTNAKGASPTQVVTPIIASPDDEQGIPVPSTSGHHRCATCGKGFMKPNQLRIHNREHCQENYYTCFDCCLHFPTKFLLSKHERTEKHFAKVEAVEIVSMGSDPDPRPFKCKECSIAFRIPGHLAKHLRSRGHLMTLERTGRLPPHKEQLLRAELGPDENDLGSPEESSERLDSSAEMDEDMDDRQRDQ